LQSLPISLYRSPIASAKFTDLSLQITPYKEDGKKLQLGFVIFCLKIFGAKAACNMLMKLTTGICFINILRVAFVY